MIFFDMNKREDLKEKCSTLFSIFELFRIVLIFLLTQFPGFAIFQRQL